MGDPICQELAKLPSWVHPSLMALSFFIYMLIGYITGRHAVNKTLSIVILALLNYLFKRPNKAEKQQNKES